MTKSDRNSTTCEEQKPLLNSIDSNVHQTIVLWLFIATLVITIFVAIALIISDLTGKTILTILPVVILAGVLGSFVSALNRIYSSSNIFPIVKYEELLRNSNNYLIAYSSIPPLVGAISATILYIIFAGEIIKSPFFPEFSCQGNGNCDEFILFLKNWSPDQAQDFAKAIVWGFIAGFSERFVPDILNHVVSKSNEDKT